MHKVQRQDIGLNVKSKPNAMRHTERDGEETNRCGDKYSTESHIKAVKIKVGEKMKRPRHRRPRRYHSIRVIGMRASSANSLRKNQLLHRNSNRWMKKKRKREREV